MKRIYIVEDDMELSRELALLLERNGYEAKCAEKFTDVCGDIKAYAPDLLLLDINLPGADGQSILRKLRQESDLPVIMVTSKNTEMDELLSLSSGADDFIAKPFNPSILLLHIEAVFRRMGRSENSDILTYGKITLDMGRGMVKDGATDCELELTKNEMGILGYLMRNQGRIVSRDELMSYLWDSEEFVDDNTLTVNINRVRKKLSDLGYEDVIKTKRGQGYLLA